jgi:hypothetical protein
LGLEETAEDHYNLYCSPNIIRMIKSRRIRWAGHVECMVMRNAYEIVVGRSEGKIPVGRCNIEMDLWEIGLDGVGWIHLA